MRSECPKAPPRVNHVDGADHFVNLVVISAQGRFGLEAIAQHCTDELVVFAEEVCSRVWRELPYGAAVGVASTGDAIGSVDHDKRLFRLADAASLLRDPELAVSRMHALLCVHGIKA